MPASSIKKPGLPAIALSGKYLLLVEHLASRIGKEQFKSGERLPTFIQLQEAFGVTLGTVNRAMIALEQRGLIERRRVCRGKAEYSRRAAQQQTQRQAQHYRAGRFRISTLRAFVLLVNTAFGCARRRRAQRIASPAARLQLAFRLGKSRWSTYLRLGERGSTAPRAAQLAVRFRFDRSRRSRQRGRR